MRTREEKKLVKINPHITGVNVFWNYSMTSFGTLQEWTVLVAIIDHLVV